MLAHQNSTHCVCGKSLYLSREQKAQRLKTQEAKMLHVNIKYFTVSLSEARQSELIIKVIDAVKSAFGCDEERYQLPSSL